MSHERKLQTALAVCFLILIALVIYFTKHATNTKNHIPVPTAQNDHFCNYVGCKSDIYGLGNHLFYYVGTMYVAWLTKRRPCIWTKSQSRPYSRIDKVFDVDTEYVDIEKLRCPFHKFEHYGVYMYDSRVKSLVNVSANTCLLYTSPSPRD